MRPARGRCLVRKVETEETLPGGLVILTENVREAMTAQQVEVIMIGEWPHCDDEDCPRIHGGRIAWAHDHPCELTYGDWAVVAPRSLVETDEDGLYVVAQDDVLAVLAR